MHIYAIGDLHLSGDPPRKPMDIFGEKWRNHKEKISENWLNTVGEEDAVIVCGDISWAMTLQEAAADLDWLVSLPGRKILLRGNHDYWWSSINKMQAAYGNKLEFLQNNSLLIGETAVCGTRGWLLPSTDNYTEEDKKIYAREGLRLELSLKAAEQYSPKEIIAAFHLPPLFKPDEQTIFTELLEKHKVKYCIFGHIHGENREYVFEGTMAGTNYKLVSCDTQNFSLFKII